MPATRSNAFKARAALKTPSGNVDIYRLAALEQAGLCRTNDLPYSIRVLLENVLRNVDGRAVLEEHVRAVAGWNPTAGAQREIPFRPARIILQDFTGVPILVDLAAMRSAMQRQGGDPRRINPRIPVDLVVDHSVQVDYFASPHALELNAKIEFRRNRERYEFLRWGQNALDNFRVVPPTTGIVHQINLEFLAQVVVRREINGHPTAFPDTLVGSDSHTTMINSLGVLGWGVGGIEAEAAMLGQPIWLLMPDVVGLRLTGRLRERVTATDVALRVTELLRGLGAADKFVEFFGDGLSSMSLSDRATIAVMAPEYRATMGFFAVDDATLDYLRLTGRPAEDVDFVERYCKEQGLFRTGDSPNPKYTQIVELDLDTVEPSLAGPKRLQDRVGLPHVRTTFASALSAPPEQLGFGLSDSERYRTADVRLDHTSATLTHGSVVIAALTGCASTSNPAVMIAAGLLARKAVEKGLTVKPWVKTSLAPGSRVVTDYLTQSGLTPFLEKLGFHTVGYGCTTCFGNGGPLPEATRRAVQETGLVVAAVLSGSRHCEGCINPHVKATYLASPPLVVAYALAGTLEIDLAHDPLTYDEAGRPVSLRDLWPTQAEIDAVISRVVTPDVFRKSHADVFGGPPEWRRLGSGSDLLYEWDEGSTYIQEPPFFTDMTLDVPKIAPIRGARCLAMLGDCVTGDHISPAGIIDPGSPAGRYLQEHGVEPADFNSYGSRRGNDRVMIRGTFADPRTRNLLTRGIEGGRTLHLPTGIQMSIFDAAMKYKEAGTPLIILAGKDYGVGSSRDWAAKGTMLLGVRAVIAAGFDRTHRSNLAGVGVLPLQFKPGQSCESLALNGRGSYDIPDLTGKLKPLQELTVIESDASTGRRIEFPVICRLDTPIEVEYYRHGGVLRMVLRGMLER